MNRLKGLIILRLTAAFLDHLFINALCSHEYFYELLRKQRVHARENVTRTRVYFRGLTGKVDAYLRETRGVKVECG